MLLPNLCIVPLCVNIACVLVCAGTFWDVQVPGGCKTVCCLAGFKTTKKSMRILVLDVEAMDKAMAGAEYRPKLEDYYQMDVLDLFKNCSPSATVSLHARDAAEQLKELFVSSHGRALKVWESISKMESKEDLTKQKKN